MISHSAIEDALSKDDISNHMDCIVGVRDDATGEELLVLLTTRSLTRNELRTKLQSAGLPNLWISKELITVKDLPLPASGKLDRVACQNLADSRFKAGAAFGL